MVAEYLDRHHAPAVGDHHAALAGQWPPPREASDYVGMLPVAAEELLGVPDGPGAGVDAQMGQFLVDGAPDGGLVAPARSFPTDRIGNRCVLRPQGPPGRESPSAAEVATVTPPACSRQDAGMSKWVDGATRTLVLSTRSWRPPMSCSPSGISTGRFVGFVTSSDGTVEARSSSMARPEVGPVAISSRSFPGR